MSSKYVSSKVKRKRDLGLQREVQHTRNQHPHPKCRGSKGYDMHWRVSEIARAAVGHVTTCCDRSIFNWKNRLEPYHQSGNTPSNNIVGMNQMLLVFYLIAYPDALLDEIAAFIANASHDGKVYSRGEIGQRLHELKITRKRGSTEAYQAFTPWNMHVRKIFWEHPLPFGIHGTARRRFIDIDECGIEMQSTNRKHGYAYSGARVRKPGNYSRDVKVTVILAVEPGDPRLPSSIYGSVEWPRRWAKVDPVPGTTSEDFDDFLKEICEDLLHFPPPGQEHERRVFLWDNLGSHTSPIIHQTVEADYGHIIKRRPAYRPADGPIEYVFLSACGSITESMPYYQKLT